MKTNKLKILVVTSNYPSDALPNYGAFVYTLMQELGTMHDITIISPEKFHNFLKKKKGSYGEEKCKVYRPLYFSLGNKAISAVKLGKISSYLYNRAVNRAIRKLPAKPDLVYTHFLYNAKHVLQYATAHDIPLVVASGESSFNYWNRVPRSVQSQLQQKVSHIICVSAENQQQLIQRGFDQAKLSVIPNAVNYSLFKPLDKSLCKEKLGLPKDKFIVGFIGHFINRKGPNRIIEAITGLNDPDIRLVCVGSRGQLTPNSFTTVFAPIPNHQVPDVLNAFDVFVLPTLSEGHCNVIEEAKACAVPVISSKGTSVETQIDDSIGVLVDPTQIEEIAGAIKKLKTEPRLVKNMVENLISRRGENSIRERANKISQLLHQVVESDGKTDR